MNRVITNMFFIRETSEFRDCWAFKIEAGAENTLDDVDGSGFASQPENNSWAA
jgi:hypothetical protein